MLGGLLSATPWRALLGLATAGAALGAVGVAVGPGTGTRLVQLALVLLGGAAACVLDEPSAAVVDACPVDRPRRVAARAVAAGVPAATGVLAVGTWWAAHGLTAPLALQSLGCVVLGFAAATVARTRLAEPAEVVAPALVLGLLATMLAEPLGRWVDLFPAGPSDRSSWTWALVLGGCLAALAVVVPERRWRVR